MPPDAAPAVRVFVEAQDRLTTRLVTRLRAADLPLELIDVNNDPDARRYVERLACCGRIYPVVEAGGLTLLAPKPGEVLELLAQRLPTPRTRIIRRDPAGAPGRG